MNLRVLFLLFPILLDTTTRAYAPVTRVSTIRPCALTLNLKLFGKGRRKRNVEELPPPISIGASLPDMEVEVVESNEGDDVQTTTMSISEVLGAEGSAVLVGMPGAYTTTCNEKHMPGFIEAAPKLKKLGVDKIAVVTTNDRFVNKAWAKSFGLLDSDSNKEDPLTLISDGDGDLVRSMGMMEDMGFGVGVRSKRFAIVLEDGTVSRLLVDDGMDDCEASSPENLVKVLSPEKGEVGVPAEKSAPLLLGGAALLLAALYFASSGDGTGSTATFELLNDHL